MLAYRHAFHAGSHADVLKHLVYLQVLRHLNSKDKGWRAIDTHAGAGGYALDSRYARQRAEHADGIGRLWGRTDLPPATSELAARVRDFNGGDKLAQYPGSPALALALRRPQDELRCAEKHPTDHRILAAYLAREAGTEVMSGDGFAALRGWLPPPTRRGVVLVDPSYELKSDYTAVLAALRDALMRFADGIVIVWLPQLQLLEAAQLPQRLRGAAAPAKKGWLYARLTVAPAAPGGFGLLGSSVFVVNPPHTLAPTLRAELPFLARVMGRFDGATSQVEEAAA